MEAGNSEIVTLLKSGALKHVYSGEGLLILIKGKNIARGTTDPEIDSETWTKLGNNMAPLALIANLATRWRHLTFSH